MSAILILLVILGASLVVLLGIAAAGASRDARGLDTRKLASVGMVVFVILLAAIVGLVLAVPLSLAGVL